MFSTSIDLYFLHMKNNDPSLLVHMFFDGDNVRHLMPLTKGYDAIKLHEFICLFRCVSIKTDLAVIFSPPLTVDETLAIIYDLFHCDEFQLADSGLQTRESLFDSIHQFLLWNHYIGRNALLVIDKAEKLLPGVLKQLSLLTNLETDEEKLLNIVLINHLK